MLYKKFNAFFLSVVDNIFYVAVKYFYNSFVRHRLYFFKNKTLRTNLNLLDLYHLILCFYLSGAIADAMQ